MIGQDLRYAVRTLGKQRAFTAVAVLTLAFALGANSAIFSVVNGILLQPLSYPKSEQIVKLTTGQRSTGTHGFEFSWPNFVDLRATSKTLQNAVAYYQNAAFFYVGAEPERYEDLDALRASLDAGAEPPDVVVMRVGVDLPSPDAHSVELAEAARAECLRTLERVRSWLAEERLSDTRVAVLTRNAIATRIGEPTDLAATPQWGLIRSVQSEQPGRFTLIDLDDDEASLPALVPALAIDEPEIALREGKALSPRLARGPAPRPDAPPPFDSEGTVLVTGGTGAFGQLVARRLGEVHGVKHMLLVSRRSAVSDDVARLIDDLAEVGCTASVEACDVADRDDLARLIESIPAERPLRAVVHTAGVLDDAMIDSLEPKHFERVMRPKVDAAMHLHQLTADMDLTAFVLFSSSITVLGAHAQANYAAASVFVDALAHHRHAHGLPAVSIAWGLMGLHASGMISGLTEAEVAKRWEQIHARMAMLPLSSEGGIELHDAGCASGEPHVVAVKFDLAMARAQARTGVMPSMLRGLVSLPAKRAESGGSLARRLAEAPEEERDAVTLDLVRSQVAAVLGQSTGEAVEPDRAFSELGFDSLAAVELRNRLRQGSGLRLPATLVFDYPTPQAVAGYLRELVGEEEAGPRVDDQIDKLEALVASITSNGGVEPAAGSRLRALGARLQAYLRDASGEGAADGDGAAHEDLESASAEEIFEIIEEEFGS